MENFLWAMGVIFQTRFGYCRKMLTKINALITTVDYVYDVYGTLDR
jgi:(-)-alpha-terpineol synthase